MIEANITINGKQISSAMSTTIRVAIESFACSLSEDGLGEDNTVGKAICEAYKQRINEIRKLLYNAQ